MKFKSKFFNIKCQIAFSIIWVFSISSTCFSQLSGTYTIDPGGGPFPNFVTLKAAIDTMRNQGIDSAVVFNVADGNYYLQLSLYPIPGASTLKTITFQGNESDSTLVRLYHEDPNCNYPNYIITAAANARYYTFRKMTLEATGISASRVMLFNQGGNDILIENCLLKSANIGSSGDCFSLIYCPEYINLVARNNFFQNGSKGIWVASASGKQSKVEITGNEFYRQYDEAIILDYCDNAIVHNNSIYSNIGMVDGIYFQRCNNSISIRGNIIFLEIYAAAPYENAYGIKLLNCSGNGIENGLTANNFISISGTIRSNALGIESCQYQELYHNSINYVNTSGSPAFMRTTAGISY